MSNTPRAVNGQTIEEPGDAELISAVRGGDVDAYGDLFTRHVESARRLARQLVSAGDADDLVSEAFAKVLVVLQRGGGPDLAFRAYLLTAVRRLHVDRIRSTSRLKSVDDLAPYDPGVPFRDTAVEGFENETAARAFASLPERWQMVLWHTEVEGQKPADVAPLLGMTANSVSALAYRAREGLRQAFVSMHAQEAENDDCAWTQQSLGAYIRNSTSRRDGAKVQGHVTECRRCMAIYLELTEVNSNLGGILAPLVLGSAAASYVAGAAGGIAAKGGLLFLLDRGKDVILANAGASAVAGVAATAVIAAGIVVGMHHSSQPAPRADSPSVVATSPAGPGKPDATGASPTSAPASRTATGTSGVTALNETRATEPVANPTDPTHPATGTTEPVENPTDPTDPTGEPSGEPTQTPGPPMIDVSVSSSKTDLAGLLWDVRIAIEGLPAGHTATLSITADEVSVALTLDPRCGFIQIGRARCLVRTTPTTFRFLALPVPGSATTLTFTVSPDGDAVDPALEDNTTRVLLAP